jgi:t-SNARE complex subunit (syntaxin)
MVDIEEIDGMSTDEEDNVSQIDDTMSGTDSTRRSRGSSTDDQENYFANAESRKVRNLKILVLTILLCVTIAVCLAVYLITSKGQEAEFEGA